MNRPVKSWVRGTAVPLALMVGFCLPAVPLTAAELPASASVSTSSPRPVALAAAAKLAALDAAAAYTTTQAAAPDPVTGDAKSFFKSPKGILALTLAAAGVGYVIYSSQNDRIKSPIRN